MRYWALASLMLPLAACQSSTAEFADPPGDGDRWTLGELVYEILHANLERADECAPEMVGELEADRERFITTFDHTITNDIVDELPDVLGGTILPLVDDGSMPQMTDALAQALALLVDDEFDPDRKALGAVVDMGKARTVLSESRAIELVSRILADPTITDKARAITGLALEDDGADVVVSSALDLARRVLAEPEAPSACAALEAGDLASRLLSTEGFTADPAMGLPAWTARADANGNPAVRVDPATGSLYSPFVDADADGAADVDDRGRPVDASGQPIEIPILGTSGSRDPEGRALAADGALLYDYYDAKQTMLAHLVEGVREAGEAGVHHDAVALLEAALGEQLPCSDGTGTCYRYASTNHPIADLGWMLLEAARYERAATLLQTFATLVRDNPDVAERLMLAVGDLLEAFEASGIELVDPELLDIAVDLVPLLADLFAADNTTGESTARLLLDVVHDLGDTARDFPDQLAMTVGHVRLYKANECSAEEPDLSRSTPVDFDRARFYDSGGTLVDNRSSLEQSIELLAHADCGSVPFTGGKSVGYVLLDLMADRSPGTVCQLVDLFLGAIDVIPGAGRFVTVEALDAIGCDGDAVYDHLQALDDLAKSGALDFYLPVLRVLKARGQIDTILEIIQYVAADLQKDEDGSATSRSAVRRVLPVIQRILATDAPDVLFELDDLLVSIPAADGDGDLADVTVDAVDNLLRESETVSTRQGEVTGSSIARELVLPLREVVVRLDERGGGAHLDAILDHARGYLTRDRMVGTERRLADPNLVPMIAEGLDVAAELVDRPRSDYLCWVDEIQNGSEEALTSREFATGVRLVRTLGRSPHGATIEEFVLGLLLPRPHLPEAEVLGPLLEVVAALLSSDASSESLNEILRWLGAVAGQRSGDGPDLVRTLDRMLASDENEVVITIARTLFAPGPLGSGEAPMSTFGDVFSDVSAVSPDAMCTPEPMDVADAEEVVRSVVGFMGDDEAGLGAIYDLVGRRSTDPSLGM